MATSPLRTWLLPAPIRSRPPPAYPNRNLILIGLASILQSLPVGLNAHVRSRGPRHLGLYCSYPCSVNPHRWYRRRSLRCRERCGAAGNGKHSRGGLQRHHRRCERIKRNETRRVGGFARDGSRRTQCVRGNTRFGTRRSRPEVGLSRV
jgi:hypothetical protein